MIINNNIPALNTYRQMGANQEAGQNSMQKLASGLRINNAADDAAGLAISEKMRAQIRGLDQASRNGQDGISMIQTAEGALQETHDILQRMRELATQAANDTNVEVDREEIQKEMNALTSEINRIGNTTEFNTQNILRGAEPGLAEGVDYGVTDLDNLRIADTSTLEAGDYTMTVGDGATVSTALAGDGSVSEIEVDTTSTLDGDYQIATTFDGTAGNLQAGTTDTNAITDVTYNGTNNDDIADDYEVEFIHGAGDTSTIILKDSNGDEIDRVENIASGAGTATIGNFTFTLAADLDDVGASEATDGYKTFDVTGNGWEAEIQDVGGANGQGAVQINPGDEDVDLGNGVTANFADNLSDGDVDTFSVSQVKVATLTDNDSNVVATQALTDDTDDIAIADTGLTVDAGTVANGTVEFTVTGGDFTSNFQIGANSGQSMTINIEDMRSVALGVSGVAGEAAHDELSAAFTAVNNVSNGTDNDEVEAALDVSSHEKAQAAITVINDAIEHVSSQRSELGAFQNRLEHTISNLGNASENLSAAESRIRDVDMAREMMEMTKSNILSQASQSMLAQANQAPQSVLQLLG